MDKHQKVRRRTDDEEFSEPHEIVSPPPVPSIIVASFGYAFAAFGQELLRYMREVRQRRRDRH